MNKTMLIFKREYFSRVKKKSFLLVTFIGPLLFAAVLSLAIYLGVKDDSTYNVILVDSQNIVTKLVQNQTEPRVPQRFQHSDPKKREADNVKFFFTSKPLSNAEFKESTYNILLEIDKEVIESGKAKLVFKKSPSVQSERKIERRLERAVEEQRILLNAALNDANFTYDDYKKVNKDLSVGKFELAKLIEQEETGNLTDVEAESDKTKLGMVGFVMSILILIMIMMFGTNVMRGVIEEKTSRIIEVIVSSVKPKQLMMGKVLGVGAVGLTQFFLWIILFSVIFAIFGSVAVSGPEVMAATTDGAIAELPPEADQQALTREIYNFITTINWLVLIPVFIFYFFFGYMLYASIFAAIGSAVDSETETQQFMLPVMAPLMFAMYFTQSILMNPDSSSGDFFAIFPLTSPVVMLTKVAMGMDGNWGTLLLSMLALVATFFAMIWVAGKIYRTGILMYGKKASWKEMLKWIRYS